MLLLAACDQHMPLHMCVYMDMYHAYIYIRVGPVHASDQCRRQHACHTMYTLSSDIVWMYSCRAVRLTLATLQNDLHSCAVTAEANDLTLVVTIQACVPSRVAAEAAGQVCKQFFNSMPLPSPCRLGPAQNCEACVYSCGCSQVHKAVWSGCLLRMGHS